VHRTITTGASGAPAEANATGRRFGFVTTLSLQDKDETPSQRKSAEPVQ